MMAAAALIQGIQRDFSYFSGPYLGQKPPGQAPEGFAPEIFESLFAFHNGVIVFTSDGTEAYWQARIRPADPDTPGEDAIFTSRMVQGRWTRPAVASFSEPNAKDDAPFVSPDGEKLYFLSGRSNGRPAEDQRIWFVERKGEGWSGPSLLPIDTGHLRLFGPLSVDRKQNLYFSVLDKTGKLDVYSARWNGDGYGRPEKLGPEINQSGSSASFSPFISPDGSFLMFSRQDEKPQLFLSFRRTSGGWTEAADLGGVLGKDTSFSNPWVSHDGKYLFFQNNTTPPGYPGGFGWVDAGFIETLRPRDTR